MAGLFRPLFFAVFSLIIINRYRNFPFFFDFCGMVFGNTEKVATFAALSRAICVGGTGAAKNFSKKF